MHSHCFGCYARCHSTLGARAYFFYVTKFLHSQCTRNSRDIYIYIYLYIYISSIVTAHPLSPQEGARSRSPQLLYIHV